MTVREHLADPVLLRTALCEFTAALRALHGPVAALQIPVQAPCDGSESHE